MKVAPFGYLLLALGAGCKAYYTSGIISITLFILTFILAFIAITLFMAIFVLPASLDKSAMEKQTSPQDELTPIVSDTLIEFQTTMQTFFNSVRKIREFNSDYILRQKGSVKFSLTKIVLPTLDKLSITAIALQKFVEESSNDQQVLVKTVELTRDFQEFNRVISNDYTLNILKYPSFWTECSKRLDGVRTASEGLNTYLVGVMKTFNITAGQEAETTMDRLRTVVMNESQQSKETLIATI